MNPSEEEKCILWLCACTDLDERDRAALLRAAGDPLLLFNEFETFYDKFIKPRSGRSCRCGTLSRRREERERLVARLGEKDYFFLTPESGDYPASLREIPVPPLVLYGAGNRALLKARKFCVVGSRMTPPWAEKQGKLVAETLSKRFVVVTGLAEGGDTAAIEGALGSGNLISVLPCGLDECYPSYHASLKEQIRRKGLLLSEYPPAERVKRYSFHARNRLLAGLSEGVLVLSAGIRSGALITANYAVEYNRDVFAFPYNLGVAQGAGCNELIKRGAYLFTDAKDVFSLYGMEEKAEEGPSLTEAEGRVLALLRTEGELHSALIAERTGLKIFEAAAILSSLEVKGLVAKSGGNRYSAL